MLTITVNNSYCGIQNSTPQIDQLIDQLLTTHNDIEAEKSNIFYQMNMAKRYNNKKRYGMLVAQLKALEESEYVHWYQNGQFPTGHLNMVVDLLKAVNIQYVINEQRERVEGSIIFRLKNKFFPDRYYQEEMISLGLIHGRGVFESAVGTGKTHIMMRLIKEISCDSLIIVPSRGLRDQVYNELKSRFGQNHVQKVDSTMVRKGKTLKSIKICTVQTLAALNKSGELHMIMNQVEAVYIDEIHHAGSKSYTDLLPAMDHIYWRFGFTGTFLRNDSKSLDMWGFLSNKLYSYPAWKAIEDGYLTPIEVISYELSGKKKPKYQKEYDANYCGGEEILNKVLEIVQTNHGQQILILVNKKDKAGLLFHEMLNAYGIENAYISGDNDEKEISQAIEDFNDKKINILIGSSVIGEGIDIKSADHLIMCQGGKSEIAIVQATGRLVRLYEGKVIGYLHDFRFINTKYMEKHYAQRVDIYDRNFQPKYREAA